MTDSAASARQEQDVPDDGASIENEAPPEDAVPTGPLNLEAPASRELVDLATAYGVASDFKDWRGVDTHVRTGTIVAVLAALDVHLESFEEVRTALAEVNDRPWRRPLPPVVVTREGRQSAVLVHLPQPALADVPPERTAGHAAALRQVVELTVATEDGERHALSLKLGRDTREIDGIPVRQLVSELPEDLPLGWHTLHLRYPDGQDSRPLVVTPERVRLPAVLEQDRVWGFMTQLYSVRSASSWGLGDLADLAELASWSAREHGAGFVLVNPLHAAEPVPPMEPSPYLPTSRRFLNPIYLRVEDIRETAYMPATERAIIEWQAEAIQALNTDPGELSRDAVWSAKRAALESVFAVPRSRARQASFEAFLQREGDGLADFAMWSALAERYGARISDWPAHVADPASQTVEHMRDELAGRVAFHAWLQWCLDEQLTAASRTAHAAGMPVGIVHDLAVGVHPEGADAWALQDVLAHDVTAGAPPDAFNQQGQDWSQPPWRPDRLAEVGYAPYRDMLRTVLRHAGALRVDHIIGLFRLWWVPRGHSPLDGTYVRYDVEALVGILALEAHRAGAFVIGEDLGTVEPSARDYLLERGILGTSILWFEKDAKGRPLAAAAWRELCLATVTTHDLPPTAGYLAGEHIELRQRLKLLTRPVAEEQAVDEADRAAVLRLLEDMGLVGDQPTERDKVEALHAFLARTPARMIGVALADATGDRRAMNQPGTSNEYPNWRLPLADGVGQPLLLEDVMESIRVTTLARAVQKSLHES